MDDKLRSEVMGDIDYLRDSLCSPDDQVSIAGRLEGVMTDHEHLELQMLQAKRIIRAICEAHSASWETTDIDFALISAGKDFLEENDDRPETTDE